MDLKTDGRLVGTFKKEDKSCLRGRSWNFELPFVDTFDHGQILVNWKHSTSGNIPLVNIYGIADSSMKILISQEHLCQVKFIFVSSARELFIMCHYPTTGGSKDRMESFFY